LLTRAARQYRTVLRSTPAPPTPRHQAPLSKPKNPYRRPDAFTKAAKAQGYPARSVFKLEEIDRRVRLLRPGQRVLDLGAAPGSWSLYVAKQVGPQGRLLAIDLQPIAVPFGPNVQVSQGDALSLANDALAVFAPYDVVLSDMAPSTTGSKVADQARSFELFMRALAVCEALGKRPGGSFVGKLFMSEDFTKAREALRKQFDEVRVLRPEGTRSTSFEVFLVGLGRKPLPPSA
jgi:23S rRNA (uridine2552-2'-O)-methyltransferase